VTGLELETSALRFWPVGATLAEFSFVLDGWRGLGFLALGVTGLELELEHVLLVLAALLLAPVASFLPSRCFMYLSCD
jgi:hypothetical protein